MPLKCKVGIDLVYMPRYLKLVNDEKFLNKVLTEKEYQLLKQLNNPRRQLEFLCGRFACKEAYSKALKTGIGKFDFKDIEILKNNDGAPYCSLENVEVSITHDNDYAMAIVMVGVENE